MRVIDPGHVYMLAHLDGERESRLEFVKREGRGYPGNVGHHEGTNIQEVLRALMDRVEYLDRQIPCAENKQIAVFLRQSIFLLERRAAQRHNRYFDLCAVGGIESLPTCRKCGHIHNEDAAMQPLSAEQGVNPMADRVAWAADGDEEFMPGEFPVPAAVVERLAATPEGTVRP